MYSNAYKSLKAGRHHHETLTVINDTGLSDSACLGSARQATDTPPSSRACSTWIVGEEGRIAQLVPDIHFNGQASSPRFE
jgi:hypothetical protein